MKLFSHSRHRLLAWYNASAVNKNRILPENATKQKYMYSLLSGSDPRNSAAALSVFGRNEKKTHPALKSIYLCPFSLYFLGTYPDSQNSINLIFRCNFQLGMIKESQ